MTTLCWGDTLDEVRATLEQLNRLWWLATEARR